MPNAFAVLRLMINCTLLDWQVGGLLALEDAARVNTDEAVIVGEAASIASRQLR